MRLMSGQVGVTLLTAIAVLFAPGLIFAQDRVDPIPAGPTDIVAALSPFRANPGVNKVADLLNKESADTGFPLTDHDLILVARLWGRAGYPDRGLKKLESVDPGGAAIDLARYEAARLLLSQGDRDGARLYWRACGSTDPATRAEIAWDLLPVSIPEERESWTSLQPGDPTCEWLRDFWDERAQKMAVEPAERIAVHFERLAFARERYWIARPRFEKTTSSYHGRPGGLAIDDRGLIYVRMGPPTVEEFFTDEGAGQPEGAETIAERLSGDSIFGRRGSCWPYWRLDGYRIYCFTNKSNRADSDFVLTDGVPGGPGSRFYQQYVLNSNVARSAANRRFTNPGFGIRDPWEASLRAAERRAGNRQIQLKTRENIDAALEEVPDVPAIYPAVRMRAEALRFLNPGTRQWHVWVIAAAAAADLVRPEGEDDQIGVTGRFAVPGPDGVQILDMAPVRVASERLGREAGITLKGVFSAEPGAVPLTVVLEDLNGTHRGNWFQDTVRVPAPGGLPQLSDIAVAASEGGSWTRDGATYLQVTPAHVTNGDGSIHTYFEAYGLRDGARYEVEFRLAPTEDADRIWRLKPGDLGFRLQFASQMSGRIGRHHLRLDLSDTEPGEYVLGVRIQDVATGAYSLPAVTDLYVAER